MDRIYSKTSFIVKQNETAKVLNIILSNSLTYLNAEFLDNGNLKITILLSHVKKYKEAFNKNNFNIEFSPDGGILFKFKHIKHRLGLIVGFLILVISIFVSSKFVWKINILGNEELTDNEIIEELNNSGFNIGSYIPSINYKELHNKILLSSEKISWISINITGNIANVMIKEKFEENSKENDTYTNVISKYDGQIVSINIKDGEKKVSIGDVVKKGDLLISGVIDSKSQGIRYVNAKGTIKAYINKKIEIKIPFKNSKKIYTGKSYTYKYYKIFNKNIKFSSKYGNYDTFCDTIEKTEQITVFDSVKLPIYRTIVKYYEYEYCDVEYSKEQAVDVAFKKLRENLDNELLNAELISKRITTDFDSEFYYISCDLYCIEEIGTSVKFEVQNSGG